MLVGPNDPASVGIKDGCVSHRQLSSSRVERFRTVRRCGEIRDPSRTRSLASQLIPSVSWTALHPTIPTIHGTLHHTQRMRIWVPLCELPSPRVQRMPHGPTRLLARASQPLRAAPAAWAFTRLLARASQPVRIACHVGSRACCCELPSPCTQPPPRGLSRAPWRELSSPCAAHARWARAPAGASLSAPAHRIRRVGSHAPLGASFSALARRMPRGLARLLARASQPMRTVSAAWALARPLARALQPWRVACYVG